MKFDDFIIKPDIVFSSVIKSYARGSNPNQPLQQQAAFHSNSTVAACFFELGVGLGGGIILLY